MLFRDLGAQWVYKLMGIPVFLGLFFAAYFWLLHSPHFAVHRMPRIWLDECVPLREAALPWYLSLWLYLVIAVGLIATRRGLGRFLRGAIAISLTAFVIFFFWPTALIPSAPVLAEAPRLRWLATVDATGNACPSLHVAFVVYSAGWLLTKLRSTGVARIAAWVALGWGAAIIYSTMATGQHVALDVAGGALLGAAGLFFQPPSDEQDTEKFTAPALVPRAARERPRATR